MKKIKDLPGTVYTSGEHFTKADREAMLKIVEKYNKKKLSKKRKKSSVA